MTEAFVAPTPRCGCQSQTTLNAAGELTTESSLYCLTLLATKGAVDPELRAELITACVPRCLTRPSRGHVRASRQSHHSPTS